MELMDHSSLLSDDSFQIGNECLEFSASLSGDQIDPKQHAGLSTFFEKMTGVPFELNAKANIYLQGCDILKLNVVRKGGWVRKRMESGYGKRDTGVKIIGIYFPQMFERTDSTRQLIFLDFEEIRLGENEKETKNSEKSVEDPQPREKHMIPIEGGELFLLSARRMAYASEVFRRNKIMFISFFIKGSGDAKAGHI
eukprot:Trichotokara_eunicae@DN3384_c0_g1_i1.p1